MIHIHAPHRAPHDQAVSPPLSLPYYSTVSCADGETRRLALPDWDSCARDLGRFVSPRGVAGFCNIDNNSYTPKPCGAAEQGPLRGRGIGAPRSACWTPRLAQGLCGAATRIPRHGQLLGRTNCCSKSHWTTTSGLDSCDLRLSSEACESVRAYLAHYSHIAREIDPYIWCREPSMSSGFAYSSS